MRRVLWNTLGFASLGLGLIGAVLPLLPTTPFMLLAAFAFGQGSPRFRVWICFARPRAGSLSPPLPLSSRAFSK
jgi:uncharacterized membrane protein YbaN (DUF454 family)